MKKKKKATTPLPKRHDLLSIDQDLRNLNLASDGLNFPIWHCNKDIADDESAAAAAVVPCAAGDAIGPLVVDFVVAAAAVAPLNAMTVKPLMKLPD